MAFVTSYAEQGTIEDVIGYVRTLLEEASYATPIMIGARYLSEPGSGPRIVFAYELSGSIGPATELGYVASETVRCDAHVRAADGGEDLERFREARALQDVLVTAIERAASGRIQWVDPKDRDDSPTNTPTGMGAGLVVSFEYTRNIRGDEKIMGVKRASADTEKKKPNIPPGVNRVIASSGAGIVEPS